MASMVNNGILNNYSIKPRNLTQYSALRGVVDWSQIGQFDQYETGYGFLSVVKMPRFMEVLAEHDAGIAQLVTSFRHMLEYEFKSMSGLPDITADTLSLTDGQNEQKMIINVTKETSVTLSSPYFERKGSLITKFAELYLTGIKDPHSKAKTYHGLIKNNLLEPSYENEVFTFMYYATDNTYLRLERAFLLANVQLTKAETSMYDYDKSSIANKEINLEWNCFPITGYEVDKAASRMLADVTGVSVTTTDAVGNVAYKVETEEGVAALDSADYKYGIMDEQSPSAISPLVEAAKNAVG